MTMNIKDDALLLELVDEFVNGLNKKFFKNDGRNFAKMFTVEVLRSRVRIVSQNVNLAGEVDKNSRSVYCFIDQNGLVYKPASWAAPAKGPRANLHDGIEKNVALADEFGGWLYKR